MKHLKGNIYDYNTGGFIKGILIFDNTIVDIVEDSSIVENCFILPGFVDAHVHIESTMLTPIEYAKECVKHGVVAAITDPHEIANVCGVSGIKYMVKCANQTPVKIFTGAPSCVPATSFETSGALISPADIESLFIEGLCSHLAEMMNFPGVLNGDEIVLKKIEVANRFQKNIDGHAPLLSGINLLNYISKNITTDHECITVSEAIEKIDAGMKIMLRESSASKDFDNLITLINSHPDYIMFCTDDCHPDELQNGYLEKLFRKALLKRYPIKNIIKGSNINAVNHYQLSVGSLKIGDYADFIVIDDLLNFSILKTYINGDLVFDGINVLFTVQNISPINKFFINKVSKNDLTIYAKKNSVINAIEIIPDSLITKHFKFSVCNNQFFLESDITSDLLKIVVVNRYLKAKPNVGFIRGFGLKYGAIGGSVSHDSHNIIVVGVDDASIISAIETIQTGRGGLVAISDHDIDFLPLPIGGLMSDKSCSEVASQYRHINESAKKLGTQLNSPFMTLAFMSLLVIPELKISDRGLFNINTYSFIDLQD